MWSKLHAISMLDNSWYIWFQQAFNNKVIIECCLADKYFPCFSYFVAKNEKLGKYFPFCTQHFVITTTYKMIIDLSKQQATDADPKALQQISFTGNLDPAGETTLYFIIEEPKRTVLDFSQGTMWLYYSFVLM